MNIEDFNEIIYEKEENGICTITLNIPKRKNALSLVTFLEIETALEDMNQDKNANVLIITGSKEANAFSSGDYVNIQYLTTLPQEIKDQIDFSDLTLKRLSLKFWDFPKPIIIVLNGLAIGSAITMSLVAGDLIYASEDAWIGYYFVRNAVLPILGGHFTLPFLVGLQKAKEIAYFGDKITAHEAEKLGLINKVLPSDQLMPYAREQALRLIPPKGPGMAIKLMKKIFHNYYRDILSKTLDLENENNAIATRSHDMHEGHRAFFEKRPPKFKGK
ncbi:MAG: enoyl-CoA hydratase/isomerase family protein [Promethearchaeota archaeon]|jgi:2-(1,2-epoxy-1,2-dihydrophenyl)acetyl-CoA isomerase